MRFRFGKMLKLRPYLDMKFSKRVKALFVFILFGGTTLFAQQMQMPQVQPVENVTDAELQKFVDIAMSLQAIGMEADQKVVARLEEEGMTTQRFQQIMMAQQNPTQDASMTTEEQTTITNMQPFLQEVSMSMQQQQLVVIQDSEISQQSFQSIAAGIQTNQELAERFQELTAEIEGAEDQ